MLNQLQARRTTARRILPPPPALTIYACVPCPCGRGTFRFVEVLHSSHTQEAGLLFLVQPLITCPYHPNNPYSQLSFQVSRDQITNILLLPE